MKKSITRNKELIPHEEMLKLAYQVQLGLDYIESQGFKRRYSLEVVKQFKDIAVVSQGLEARNRLVVGNLRFALKKAYYYSQNKANRSIRGLDDFVQAANLRLAEAVEKYDPSKGFAITTFLDFYIKDSVFIERKKTQISSLKVPLRLLQIKATLNNKIEKLTLSLGRSPTKKEIADDFKVSLAVFERAISIPSELSLSNSYGNLDCKEVTLLDKIAALDETSPDNLYDYLKDQCGDPSFYVFQQLIHSALFEKLKNNIELTEADLIEANKLIKTLNL
jgi:DNA-directed RNA polymerase specialized sigma subunit